ncbi:DUF932 domain-containing protein [Thiomicrospira sp. ALE5]|uniref:DUF932 domain-containing protein n=1 Tax=Thiomicrospira sp. ALE5 TaxID=748650 RepID=UPI0008E22D9C|nr:DUF932 domain-containing protein [Thiomicrospira sp. ALE5]SFR52695.1 protein of unknown function [Thiomicrospira sp. ALE5]
MAMTILTPEKLHQLAPAAFATQPDNQVSKRYGFVPTIDVVDALKHEGWYPVRALQTNVRDEAKRAVTKHMIRFRQDPDRQLVVGDCLAELVLTNSHDRTAAYQLDLGLFRLACSNGMVTQTGDLGGIKVKHGKHIVDSILDGSLNLLEQVPHINQAVDHYRATLISKAEARLYATAALTLRYGNDWRYSSPVSPDDLLTVRRTEDHESSLWKVFNRVQENLFKGGLAGRSSNGRNVRTRPIQSVSEDVKLNRALWQLTESFSKLKEGQIAHLALPNVA